MIEIFHKHKREKGFTLMELMIVIAIIGILAAIAVPQFIKYRKRGYTSTLNSDCKNAYTASVAYMDDNPNATRITLTQITGAGYSQTTGVAIRVRRLTGTSGTITCSNTNWGVTNAVITITSGEMSMTTSQITY